VSEETGVAKSLTYTSYLRLDELLNLQTPKSAGPAGPEHDEMLFIVIHQVYELWFKELLHEIDYLSARLRANDAALASHTVRRILAILKTAVAQLDVLETMTPLEFNSFRGFLETASGFQSAQFRELEFVLGYKRDSVFHSYSQNSSGWRQLKSRYSQPTLWDAFLAYLAKNGYAVPAQSLERDVTQPVEPSLAMQALLLAVYRQDATARNMCENLVDMDEGFQEWRYRHVKMVERTIGNLSGTGGSTGAQYLATTIKPFFPDLWLIRSQF
jgi:tryptophan 2,3-dioxygenase